MLPTPQFLEEIVLIEVFTPYGTKICPEAGRLFVAFFWYLDLNTDVDSLVHFREAKGRGNELEDRSASA